MIYDIMLTFLAGGCYTGIVLFIGIFVGMILSQTKKQEDKGDDVGEPIDSNTGP